MGDRRADMLARLEVFTGDWAVEARFPGGPPGPDGDDGGVPARCRFEWALDGRFLLQRTEIDIPEAPDALAVVGPDPETGEYVQHYFDSRGVARLYAMTFVNRVWTLTRESADFTPLDFRQHFVGTFSEDSGTIEGAWETGQDGGSWQHDFALTYRRAA
ncbi:DUF1579 family protein [Actinacidiphila rubida]|uniref:DUF1579 domain-containing protein n=1 Tax=Actinacidiphila rubida TaxID=310780 RepID=A0A1H8TKR2_9ACTN|nr:DUF1579 family protein [Actinacidiphila rubida]SEO91562.1 Protein of unknown function [Actinacidiphila rubida]